MNTLYRNFILPFLKGASVVGTNNDPVSVTELYDDGRTYVCGSAGYAIQKPIPMLVPLKSMTETDVIDALEAGGITVTEINIEVIGNSIKVSLYGRHLFVIVKKLNRYVYDFAVPIDVPSFLSCLSSKKYDIFGLIMKSEAVNNEEYEK